MTEDLYARYDVPAPRYTSYPTVPYWDNTDVNGDQWKLKVKNTFDLTNDTEGISIYIHIPYCESLCTYCGCNTRITKNHSVEEPYIDALLNEWNIYMNIFKSKPLIREIHLGGGTPTFLKAENLEKLINGILLKSFVAPGYEFSIEAHPNYTTVKQLETLSGLGFRRISFGIQDFDIKVQKTINRIQSFETVERLTEAARKTGFSSVNYDLIYGLPYQTEQSVESTINKINILKPDRIAFYSYAHVPWIKPGQRSYSEADLPAGKEKRKLYETGRLLFEKNKYKEIGLDHFALAEDTLYIASEKSKLHRNFMGYTTNNTRLLVGLGASSISDAWNGFVQNEKKVESYMQAVNSGQLAILKGHNHTPEDIMLRELITDIMCKMEASFDTDNPVTNNALMLLQPMVDDGLVYIFNDKLIVPDKGKPFLRNICMAFDKRLIEKQPQTQVFSSAI
jgi:oxygen-independent coproporphyrinogen III oxidase